MLQIFTTMFFSCAALAAMAMLASTLIEDWLEVKRALGIGTRSATPHGPAPARIRPARKAPRPGARPGLRAAA